MATNPNTQYTINLSPECPANGIPKWLQRAIQNEIRRSQDFYEWNRFTIEERPDANGVMSVTYRLDNFTRHLQFSKDLAIRYTNGKGLRVGETLTVGPWVFEVLEDDVLGDVYIVAFERWADGRTS